MPTAVGESPEMWRTAKTSAMAATLSPIAEIVVEEKTRRKSRSASAPERAHMRRNLVARPYEPGLVGEHDGLHAVAQPELLQDPVHVRLDGRAADDEPGGDLAVREAARDQ